jgi:predicted transcriptional regulator of viral defense system
LRNINPHPFVIANHLEPGSYVSCQSVLAYRGLIPEYAPVTTSVGLIRPGRRKTLAGNFDFHHLKPACVFGYQKEEIARGQSAFIATAEKALIDLLYLTPASDDKAFLQELRLNFNQVLDFERLSAYAKKCDSAKCLRATAIIKQLWVEQKDGYREI